MHSHYYEEKHFVEDISLFFEEVGLPRMAGRILGVLLIASPPEQSIDELCHVLQASKSAVSTSARLLMETGLIERVPPPVPRRVYFRFKTGGWLIFMRQRMRLWSELHQITERGLELHRESDPALQERLQEAHAMFSLIEADFPALLDRFEEEYVKSRM